MIAVVIIALSILPHEVAARDRVDLIERNHFHDGDGREVFRQEIGWDWDGHQHRVVFWRLSSGMTFQERPPQLTWSDGRLVRQVRAVYWRETWTQFDPELLQREELPKNLRRGLWNQKE